MALGLGGVGASRVEGRRDLPGHSAGLADSGTKQTHLVSEAMCQQMLYVRLIEGGREGGREGGSRRSNEQATERKLDRKNSKRKREIDKDRVASERIKENGEESETERKRTRVNKEKERVRERG